MSTDLTCFKSQDFFFRPGMTKTPVVCAGFVDSTKKFTSTKDPK